MVIDKKIIKNIYKDDVPIYLYDLDAIKENIDNISNYMPSNFLLYYAIKANPNKHILKYIKSNKNISGFEVASSGELKKALHYYKNKNILFTGPGKTESELREAIIQGIKLINVESVIEAIRINKIAIEEGITGVDVLLRINLDYRIENAAENMGGMSTKFGIDECNLNTSIKSIQKLNRINIKGIHVFSASGILDYMDAILYANQVFKLSEYIEKKYFKIEYIDLGGGFGVDYTDGNQKFDTIKYFEEMNKLIKKYDYYDKKIVLELGCYLVANCGYYLSKIIDIKSSKGYKHIIISGGLNHIPTATLNGKHPFTIINMGEKKLYNKQIKVSDEIADIDGPLCTAEDKVLWSVYIKHANIGDVVVIKQAGAYCYSAAWLEFLSHPYPYEIIYSKKGGKYYV